MFQVKFCLIKASFACQVACEVSTELGNSAR